MIFNCAIIDMNDEAILKLNLNEIDYDEAYVMLWRASNDEEACKCLNKLIYYGLKISEKNLDIIPIVTHGVKVNFLKLILNKFEDLRSNHLIYILLNITLDFYPIFSKRLVAQIVRSHR